MDKGKIIKRLREQKGFSQVELADKIGVSKQTLYKYEKGIVTNIPSDKIEALAKVLGTTPEVLMGWAEPPKSGFTFVVPSTLDEISKSFGEEILKKQELKRLSDSVNAHYQGVQTDAHPLSYYIDAETRALAQELHDNPELSVMLDAYKALSPRDAKLVMEMVRRMQNEGTD